MQRESGDEILVGQVDKVFLAGLSHDASHNLEVPGAGDGCADRVGSRVMSGRHHPGLEKEHEIGEIGDIQHDAEMGVDETGQRHREVCAVGGCVVGSGGGALAHPVHGDGHVQQDIVGAVLIHEITLRVEHGDQVGLERTEAVGREFLLDRREFEKTTGELLPEHPADQVAPVGFGSEEGHPAAVASQGESRAWQ